MVSPPCPPWRWSPFVPPFMSPLPWRWFSLPRDAVTLLWICCSLHARLAPSPGPLPPRLPNSHQQYPWVKLLG